MILCLVNNTYNYI